jgi:hypothetical protein
MLGRWFFLAVVGLALFTYASQSGTSGAATATITQTCSAAKPGTATVTFVWPSTQTGAQQTWFDISLVPGFAWGWFQGHGPLPPTQTAYAFDGLPNGITFYYRVNTLYGTGWRETASGSFVANCGGGGGGAPVTGSVMQTCEGSGVTVKFSWQANAPGPQFIDLSIFNNGFPPGSFVGAGPIGSGGTSFIWSGLAKGTTHFWRVNTLTPAGWSSSNTGSFVTLACIPPMKACIGYMAGFSTSGRAECDQMMASGDANLAACLKYILNLAGGDKAGCVSAKQDGQTVDCLMGLSGQSYFGMTSCRIIWEGVGPGGIHG